MKIRWKSLTIMLVVFALWIGVACSPTSGEGDGEAALLIGDVWELQMINGRSPLPDSFASIEFDGEQVSGSGICNSYFGNYTASGTSIRFDSVGMTEMWCEGRMDQEMEFFDALNQTSRFEIDSKTLSLFDDSDTLLMTFVINESN